MAEKKELYEQYEEAFFAVLMDQIADAEGGGAHGGESPAAR